MSSEANKATIAEQIDAGHDKLDKLHELLIVLKEDNTAQSEAIAVLNAEINKKDSKIASLESIVEQFKTDLAKLEGQKIAVAQSLNSNMAIFENQRIAHNAAVLEKEQFKNQYVQLKRKVKMLADEIGEESEEAKRAKQEEK